MQTTTQAKTTSIGLMYSRQTYQRHERCSSTVKVKVKIDRFSGEEPHNRH